MAKIFKFEEARKETTPGVRTVFNFVDQELGATRMRAMMIEYEPGGTSRGVHYHEKRESAYIVLEGSATLKLNGTEHQLEPNTVVFISPGDIHGIVAIGNQGFRMIEVYSPLELDRIDIQE